MLNKKKINFKYHTHININNKMGHHVYDIAWMEFPDDEILIIRR